MAETSGPLRGQGPSSAAPVPSRRGRFIVLEGIDGSGKSTLLARLAGLLREEGVHLATTREETDTYLGEAVRRSIADGADPLATTFLFLADRTAHVAWIEGELAAGRHVLCDRFVHSTLAYQSVTLADRLHDPLAFLRALHGPIRLAPDHVLLFDVEPAVALARIQGRSEHSQYEKEAFLAKVRDAYLRLVDEEPRLFTVVDAGQDADDVLRQAADAVRSWLLGDAEPLAASDDGTG